MFLYKPGQNETGKKKKKRIGEIREFYISDPFPFTASNSKNIDSVKTKVSQNYYELLRE